MYHQPPPSTSGYQQQQQQMSSFGYLAAKHEEEQRRQQERTPSRSRSRSRSRDGYRNKHRHSKKKKHHKRHSRSRSHSRDRGTKNMHLNPSFNHGSSMGPSATALVERNNILEAEVRHVRGQNVELGSRLNIVTNELRTSQAIRQRYEREFGELTAEKKRLCNAMVESKKTIATLDNAAKTAREEWVVATKERTTLQEKIRLMELDHASNKEQVEFMTKRNATLGKKCEELVEKNRAIQNELESIKGQIDAANQERNSMQARVEVKMTEFQRLQDEFNALKEKEHMWKMEKFELEKRLSAKDAAIEKEKATAERQRLADKEMIARLERRLKNTNPYYEEQLGVESIFRALDVIKKEFAQQMQHLDEKVEPLMESAKQMQEEKQKETSPKKRPFDGKLNNHLPGMMGGSKNGSRFMRASSAPPAPFSFFGQLDTYFNLYQNSTTSKSDFIGKTFSNNNQAGTSKTLEEEMDAIFEEGDIQLRSKANSDEAENDTVLHEKELIEVESTDITLT
ncbi:hypothetical protein WR25_24088 [Diploscapter pachys]|uniref:Uncharacterized protein n=1 Tax=Diploscapter pachys TaxID=2018661 RepID=A0A2A2K900_9BILA|nr:hypothetical protein WR25_24088 [Diploscapter pachys]